jgi:CheY-like chemotaxis protein
MDRRARGLLRTSAAPSAHATTPSIDTPASGTRLSGLAAHDVLIVEDESALRRIIARNLTSRGVRVREAVTAREAVEAVTREQPDLLLLDLNLPDRSGWDVLRELRERGLEVPTVVVSAVQVRPERLAEFRPLAYLPKPFPIESLLRLVLGDSESGDEGTTLATPRQGDG